MIQDIKYNGLADNVSDYEVPDGTLETSLNLLNEDGTLNPIQQPEVACSLAKGEYVIFIHKTQQYTHYIVLDERDVTSRNLLWFSQSAMDAGGTINPAQLDSNFSLGEHEVVSINAVGNTLIVVADNTMHYFLWKQGDGNTYYKYLGTHLPQLDISFGLQSHTEDTDFHIPFPHWPENTNIIPVYKNLNFDNDKFRGLIDDTTDRTRSQLNKFIKEKCTDKNQFIFPFFVRYAYRLYDETLTMHSSPVLMIPNTYTPQVFINGFTGTGNSYSFIPNGANATIGALVSELDYSLINSKEVLKEWGDIVKSIDIFISLPIYTYKQDGKVLGWNTANEDERGYAVTKLKSPYYGATVQGYHRTFTTSHVIDDYGETDYVTIPTRLIPGKTEFTLERLSETEIQDKMESTSNFYLVKSFEYDELQETGRNIIEFDKAVHYNLATREAMTDDYDSHDMLLPQSTFKYNNRLHLANITKTLAPPRPLAALLPHIDYNVSNQASFSVYVFIKQEGREYVLKSENNSSFPYDVYYDFVYFYYPNPNAYKIVIYDETNLHNKYEVDLQEHSFLNGSFFFKDWIYHMKLYNKELTATTKNYFSLPNKLYVSEVENPYLFTSSSIESIGTGSIIGMASATKAISEGQFGQYPLYVFTTDGVWALQPDREANYREAHPVTRDVCVNAHSITPIDNAVLFAAQRGIMLLHGGSSTCISDSLFNHTPFDVTTLPHLDFASLDTILPTYIEGTKPYSDYLIPLQPDCMVPFPEFLKRCRMLFDYTNQRIIVFNPATDTQEYDPVVPVVPDDPDAPDTPVEQDDNTPGIGPLPEPLTSSSSDTEAAIPTLLHPYAYVYSLKTKRWGMMVSSFYSSLNAYPDALAMDISSKVLSLRLPSAPSPLPLRSLLVTRPLKLGNGNVLKSVHTVVHRGQFPTNKVRTLLYGSRDLLSWHLIASSKGHEIRNLRGTPYKYFRVATIADLTEGQSIYGVSIEFDVRQTNRMH